MSQVLRSDIINPITFLSTTTVQMAANSYITVGGQQYTNSSALILNTATIGVNGLDTGTLAASTYYYVYAVQSVGTLALVASTSSSAPTGFSSSTWTGFVFVTNGSTQISQVTNSFTTTVLTSGSGTYNTPSKAVLLKIRMVGGGSGGFSQNDTGPSNPGTDSTFGGSLLVAHGAPATGDSTVGGSVSVLSPALAVVTVQGAPGNPYGVNNGTSSGGVGGVTPFGGAGVGGRYSLNGGNGQPNTGSGGGGAGGKVDGTTTGGRAGNAGGYLEAVIASPVATYTYAVGSGGAGTVGNTSGGNGGSGVIIIEEHYKY